MNTIHTPDRLGGLHPDAPRRYRTRITRAIGVLGTGAALAASAALLTTTSASATTGARQHISAARHVVSPSFATVGPTADIVGKGLVNCKVATGEVGYSPTISSAGSTTATEWYSIWFTATRCAGASTGTRPVPTTVIGALSFKARQGTVCPQFGILGKGYLYLTYEYPGVPNPMIDPSVGLVTVNTYGAFWHLHGTIFAGSYKDPAGVPFDAGIKPNLIGGHGCNNGGIDSEYIARLAAPYWLSRI